MAVHPWLSSRSVHRTRAGTVKRRASLRRRVEDHHELTATGFDCGAHLEARFEPGDPVDEPVGSSDGIALVRTVAHDLAPALSLGSIDRRQDHCGVRDQEIVGPLDDGLRAPLARVARTVRESFLSGPGALAPPCALRLGLSFGGPAVDARSSRVVDRHVRVDRLVAQPAPPAVLFADLTQTGHGRILTDSVLGTQSIVFGNHESLRSRRGTPL